MGQEQESRVESREIPSLYFPGCLLMEIVVHSILEYLPICADDALLDC